MSCTSPFTMDIVRLVFVNSRWSCAVLTAHRLSLTTISADSILGGRDRMRALTTTRRPHCRMYTISSSCDSLNTLFFSHSVYLATGKWGSYEQYWMGKCMKCMLSYILYFSVFILTSAVGCFAERRNYCMIVWLYRVLYTSMNKQMQYRFNLASRY